MIINFFRNQPYNIKQLEIEVRSVPNCPQYDLDVYEDRNIAYVKSSIDVTQDVYNQIAQVVGNHVVDTTDVNEQTEFQTLYQQGQTAYTNWATLSTAQKDTVSKNMLRLWLLLVKYYFKKIMY